jgi:hypothetical protein
MAALEGKWGLCLSSALNLGEFQPLWQQTYWMTVPSSCTEWQPLHFCVLCASGSGLGVFRSVVEGIRIVLTSPDGVQLCNSEAPYM